MENEKRILVLGVGNILFTDEGVGVRTVEHLERQYEFSENVTLMDGGTLGMRLMDPIMEHDMLIVIDAVRAGDEPGSIYRLTGEDLRKSIAFRNSMHQTDLVDTLIFCEMAGKRPDAVVIGIEPFDMDTMATEVSGDAAERMPRLAEVVLKEVSEHGGTFAARRQ